VSKKLDGIKKRINGFTLIELLLVMSLVGFLITIAYPNYISYTKSTYRSYAQNDLLEITFKLEKVKNKQFSFKAAINTDGTLKDYIHKSYSPDKGDIRYRFNYEIEDNSYKIIAIPTEIQGEDDGKIYIEFNGSSFVKKWDKYNNNTYSEDW